MKVISRYSFDQKFKEIAEQLIKEKGFNFECGVSIPENEINCWIKECVEGLKDDLIKSGESHYTISSGNSLVILWAWKDKDSNEFAFKLIIAKNYIEKEIKIKNI